MSGVSEERQIFGTDGWDAERWLDEYGKARRSEAMDAEDEIIAKKVMAAGAEIRRLRAQNKELRDSYERVDRALRTVSGLHPACDQ